MTTYRKYTLLVIGLVALVAIMAPAMAFANNGVHGNYAMNTDQCAGCHRAHTAPSSITWNNGLTAALSDPLGRGGDRSALLLGNATSTNEFCYTCHGATAQGADTNVELGVYEDRSISAGAYGTDGAPLLSGAFGKQQVDGDGNAIPLWLDYQDKPVTSRHMEIDGEWPAWGGGRYGEVASMSPQWDASTGLAGNGETPVRLGCGGCHDVHGTSNYRLLKNEVYGVTVGGYDLSGNPIAFVKSNEVGFPADGAGAIGGFEKGTSYPAYQPDYTTPNYRKGDTALKGMSGWCVGCHTYYMGERDVSDTQSYAVSGPVATVHRHPVNVPLSNFVGGGTTLTAVSPSSTLDPSLQLPLAHAKGENGTVNDNTDWLDCMSCHTAHGTTAVMTGWAAMQDPSSGVITGGAGPSDDSALLRFDNRYVCQACHAK